MWFFSEEKNCGLHIRPVTPEDSVDRTSEYLAYTPSLSDIDEMLACEEATWPNEKQRATRRMLMSRIQRHPEGLMIVRHAGRVEGIVCFSGMDFPWGADKYPNHYEIGGSGLLESHDPLGHTWCGVNIGVRPDAAEQASLLLGHASLAAALLYGVNHIHSAVRIPHYHEYRDRYSPEEYVRLRTDTGRLLDEAPNFMEYLGFHSDRVQAEYYIDPDSCNYANVCRWDNSMPICTIAGDIARFVIPGSIMASPLKPAGDNWSFVTWRVQRSLAHLPTTTKVLLAIQGENQIPRDVARTMCALFHRSGISYEVSGSCNL